MKESITFSDLSRQIADSAGSAYLNRVHQRSFSLNVFQMNAMELVEAAQRVKDPGQGMALMMEKNREAGRQAHRELNRHVHNFVASAFTLVEHTRGFMRKHYKGTKLLATYEKQVMASFVESPVAQFVQGLRNYMVHRGLPNSTMYMKFSSDPDAADGSGTAETGVNIETASLLEWQDWRPAARAYLKRAGADLDIHEFAEEYLTLVNQFHGWLDATLAAHHRLDLKTLRRLQEQREALSPSSRPSSTEIDEEPDLASVGHFAFASIQSAELDKISVNLLGKIRELHFQKSHKEFPTERPTTSLTDNDLIGPITFWGRETNGESAVMFIRHEGKSYGLSEGEHKSLDTLIDAVMKSTWARASISRDFVENCFYDWARQRFSEDRLAFPEALSAAARKSVTAAEVWMPIANMEVEQGFDFGPVRIEPITVAVMESLRSRSPSPPEQEREVNQLFEKLKNDIQGYAAVVVHMEAEPSLAQKLSLQIAQDALGMLCFFAPAAGRSFVFSPVALLGAEYIPESMVIVLSGGEFRVNQSILPERVGHWRLPTQHILKLKSGPLDIAASLVMAEGLSEFALAVRASLLTYSKGITLVSPLDRLRNCLSALEGVLLRHEMEPRSHSIANRMSFLLTRGQKEREAIRQAVRQVYWLQGQSQVFSQSRRENELITVFTSYAYDVLNVALANTPNFALKAEFVIEVDRNGVSDS